MKSESQSVYRDDLSLVTSHCFLLSLLHTDTEPLDYLSNPLILITVIVPLVCDNKMTQKTVVEWLRIAK